MCEHFFLAIEKKNTGITVRKSVCVDKSLL